MSTTEEHHRREGHHEEDPRTLVPVLTAWWREIVLGTFLLAVAGGSAVKVLEIVLPRYEAWADVAIIQTETDVAFDERFKAVTSGQRRMDMRARRAALVGLVENGNVAAAAVQRIEWPDEYREDLEDGTLKAKLLNSVSGTLATIGAVTRNNQSDLIRITARAKSPEVAVAVADFWAKEYVSEVNKLYERVPQKVIDTIQAEARQALKTYEESQAELEAFTASNEIFRLENQIATNNENIKNLYLIQQEGFAALFNQIVQTQIKLLNQTYADKVKMSGLLDAASALRGQIEAAGDAAVVSNGTAIQLLKFQIYTSGDAMPDNLEIRFDHAGRVHADVSAQKADVDAVVVSLRNRIEQIDRSVIEQSASLSRQFSELGDQAYSGSIQEFLGSFEEGMNEAQPNVFEARNRILEAIFDVSIQNQALNSQKESILARKQNLEKSRELARSTFETLRNEEVELQLTAAAAPSVVRLASLAVPPEDSAWPSPALVTLGAGVVGLPIMTFLAFFMSFLGIFPLLGRRESRRSQ